MRATTQRRLRRLATVLVFVLGVVATAATSQSVPTIEVPTHGGRFRLDSDNPAAMSRVVVHANAETTSGSPRFEVRINLDGVVPNVRVIATSTLMAPTSAAASPQPTAPAASGTNEPWQLDLSANGYQNVPIECGIGPCDRAFWVLAVLNAGTAGPVTVSWTVSGQVSFSQPALPSGAGVSVNVDPPIALTAPASSLTAATDPESIEFGPERPTAARVVEVTAEPGVIAQAGASAALTVDLSGAGGQGGLLRTDVFPIDGPLSVLPLASASAPGANAPSTLKSVPSVSGSAVFVPNPGRPQPGPTPLASGADPFAGCAPGHACTRHFLVALSLVDTSYPRLTGPRAFTWQLTVRRTDLLKAWTVPAAMRVRVVRRFDVASAPPATVHLDGSARVISGSPIYGSRMAFSTATTSPDPLAALLPVPAFATLTVPLPAAWPDPQGTAIRIDQIVGGSGPGGIGGSGAGSTQVVTTYPMASVQAPCRIGIVCNELEVTLVPMATSQASAPPEVDYHWSFDLRVYSYTDVPITVATDHFVP